MCTLPSFLDYFRFRLAQVEAQITEEQFDMLNDAVLGPKEMRDLIMFYVVRDGDENHALDYLVGLTQQHTVERRMDNPFAN